MRVEVAGARTFVGTGSRSHANADRGAIVFLHGAGMDHTVWVMPARHFARKGHRVIAPDLPGHGRSAGQALESVPVMADWLGLLLDKLEVETAAVVGHSMGSLIACAFAARHAGRCERLVLLGTAAPMPVSAPLLDAAADNDHAAIEMANTWSHNRGRLGGNDIPGLWMLAGGERLLERTASGVFHADLNACNTYDPGTPCSISCPAMVISGSADMMTPAARGGEVCEMLRAGGNEAELVELASSGHAMLSENPNEVLDALIRALG